MILVKEVKKLGVDSSDRTVCFFDMLCDTDSDLPTQDHFENDANMMICQGSKARVINSATRYMMQSDGTWTIQNGSTASYTKAEVDALLAGKEDTLTFDNTPASGSTNPVTSGGIYTAIADFLTFDKIYGLAVRLPDTGINANDYNVPGVFRMQTATGAGLSSNIPLSTAAFKLIVEYVNSDTRIRQTFIPLASQGYYFIRMYTNMGWQPWYKFEGVQV